MVAGGDIRNEGQAARIGHGEGHVAGRIRRHVDGGARSGIDSVEPEGRMGNKAEILVQPERRRGEEVQDLESRMGIGPNKREWTVKLRDPVASRTALVTSTP